MSVHELLNDELARPQPQVADWPSRAHPPAAQSGLLQTGPRQPLPCERLSAVNIPGGDHALASAIAVKVVAPATQYMMERFRQVLAKRGYIKGGPVMAALERIPGAHQGRLYTLDLLDRLPPGLTNADVSRLVDSPSFKAAAHHLIAAHILGSDGDAVQSLKRKVHQYLADELPLPYSGDVRAYIEPLLDLVDKSCADVAEMLKAVRPLDESTSLWANANLSLATLESIDRRLAILASPHRPPAELRQRVLEAYRESFVGHHSKIVLPNVYDRREVDYANLFVQPSLEWSADNIGDIPIDRRVTAMPYTRMWGRWFTDLEANLDHVVLLGDPGSGKSTTSAVVALIWLQRGSGTPFFIRMREVVFNP
ncbi:MAG: hypothetical protein ACRDTS_09410, partial [Mycobacterium sp.]